MGFLALRNHYAIKHTNYDYASGLVLIEHIIFAHS